jgi:hypothetical protein
MLKTLFWLVFAYFVFMFFVTRFIVPYMGFWKERLPSKIPSSLDLKIRELKKNNKSPEKFVRAAYDLLRRKYHGSHALTFLRPDVVFSRNLGKMWARSGYLSCNQVNWILFIMLIRSGSFSENDVRFKCAFTPRLMIHQYAEVRLKGKWTPVDVWGSRYGRKFGEHFGFSFS